MNDPRITDYALGELAPAERETFERELAASGDLQRELQSTIALIEALPSTIAMNETLTDNERENLRKRAVENLAAARGKAVQRRMFVAGIGALAAGVAATAIILSQTRTSAPRHTAPVAAANTPAPAIPAAIPVPVTKPVTPVIAAATPAPTPQAVPAGPPPAQLLAEGKGFYDRGSYDLAEKRYNEVLKSDAKNISARRGLEKVAASKQEYAAAAKRETRARMLFAQGGESNGISLESTLADKDTLLSEPSKEAKPATATFAAGTNVSGAPTTPPAPLIGDIPVMGALTKSGSGMVTINGNRSGARGYIGGRDDTSTTYKESDSNYYNKADKSNLSAEQKSLGRDDESVTFGSRTASPGSESYANVPSNPFMDVRANPLSTFSIDVDTASYSNVRRFLNDGHLPPPEAVRVEELINYFPYDYPQPDGDAPFSVNTEVSRAPWDSDVLLARVALKGRDIPEDKLPPSNLVFLIDVSGSMGSEDKLPLLKRSLLQLVEKISPQDRVAIVTYAGDSGVALRSTSGEDKTRIQRAIKNLDAGGSTNGASGIKLAYDMAKKNFVKEGNNRIILCTDGDFNVGTTSLEDLTRLIERERKSNVFLSVLGFGTGNLKDATMEMLADKGNGNYAYIDTPGEGRKVLVDQMRANLFTIAKDVKIQIEFNPATVSGYRLIGYENRLLAKEDFNNDKKDAGEIGAGHTVTALYEIVPAGQSFPSKVDALKYQQPEKEIENQKSKIENSSADLFTVKLRYKAPDGDKSKLIEKIVGPQTSAFDKASQDFRFASAVAAFGMKLRDDVDDPTLDWSEIQTIARSTLGEDPDAYRAEFLTLVQKAKQLSREDGE